MVSSPSHLSFPHIQTCSPPVPVPYFVKQMSIMSEVTICLVRNWVTSSLHHSFFNDLTLADMDSYSKADAVVKVFKVGDVLLSLLILRLKLRTAPHSYTLLYMIITCCLVLNSMGDDFDNQKKRQQYCLVQNSIWKPSLSETERMQHTASTIVFSCYLKKNSFHLEFLFHHDKFFKLISGRETPGCRLHLSSWCPLSPAVRKFYRIIAPFFVASLLLSIISCGQCPAKNKCSVILEKENNEFDLRDCLCQKSLEYQFVEVLSAQVFFSFFHPSFRNYFIYNINF